MHTLTDDGRALVERRLANLPVERNARVRAINSEYESERKRLERMLETGIVPQCL